MYNNTIEVIAMILTGIFIIFIDFVINQTFNIKTAWTIYCVTITIIIIFSFMKKIIELFYKKENNIEKKYIKE